MKSNFEKNVTENFTYSIVNSSKQLVVNAETVFDTTTFGLQNWIPLLQSKQSYFLAVAEYHQALVSEGAGKYGEAVARLQVLQNRFVYIIFLTAYFIV